MEIAVHVIQDIIWIIQTIVLVYRLIVWRLMELVTVQNALLDSKLLLMDHAPNYLLDALLQMLMVHVQHVLKDGQWIVL